MGKLTFEQTTEFYEQVKSGRITRDNFQEYLRNPDRHATQFPSSAIVTKYGYTVEADVKPTTFEVKNVELVPFLEKGDKGSVTGKVLRGRAIILEANFGLVDGQYMLDHQDEIPVAMRDHYIVLTGTLLRDSDGGLDVPCLYWDGGRWALDFDWLGRVFFGRVRLARSK